jgi:hypothetical protein
MNHARRTERGTRLVKEKLVSTCELRGHLPANVVSNTISNRLRVPEICRLTATYIGDVARWLPPPPHMTGAAR